MKSAKINLIYIASNGRSGSTLLELILNAHNNIWTVGEFQVLPCELLMEKTPCGCGNRVEDCSFWGPLIRKHNDILLKGSIHRFRSPNRSGKVLRFDELSYIYKERPNSNARKEKIIEYGKENYILLQSVLKKANKEKQSQVVWLVDASKDLYRLMWLKESGYFNIFVVHLIKDPRAFVFSMTKTYSGYLKFKFTIRMLARWIIENKLIESVCKKYFNSSEVHRIQYENLAGNPGETMKLVLNKIGLEFDEKILINFRKLNHGIAGNIMRHEEKNIVLDEKWKTGLATWQKIIINILS